MTLEVKSGRLIRVKIDVIDTIGTPEGMYDSKTTSYMWLNDSNMTMDKEKSMQNVRKAVVYGIQKYNEYEVVGNL